MQEFEESTLIKFATFQDLRKIQQSLDRAGILKEASKSAVGKTVFLSHSSKDKELLPAVIHILESHGARVYVDVNDPGIPAVVSTETAQRLRNAIQRCAKFVLFVTPNSRDSHWIPWELGLADGTNSPKNVALFPSAETATETKWAEQEYLGLYKRILWGNFKGETDHQWLVYDHHRNTAEKLRSWIAD